MKFKIYPKEHEQQAFELEFDGFNIENGLLRPTLHGEVSVWGFLNLKNLAAVVPVLNQEQVEAENYTYEVHLLGRDEPLTIYSQGVDFSESELWFCYIDTNLGGSGSMITLRYRHNIYVDVSEVVAVVPKKGSLGFSSPNVKFEKPKATKQ